jgi:hypothetical protein
MIGRVVVFVLFSMGGGSEYSIQETSLGDPSPCGACQLERERYL